MKKIFNTLIIFISMIFILALSAGAASLEEDFEFNPSTGTIKKYIGKDTVVEIPSSINGVQVKSIGELAFYGCDITSITIPNGVTSIGVNAFAMCENLAEVTIPNSVNSINVGAFSYCTSLTEITIPDSVTFIGGGAFIQCSALEKVYFEHSDADVIKFENHEKLGYNAFFGTATGFYISCSVDAEGFYTETDGTKDFTKWTPYDTEYAVKRPLADVEFPEDWALSQQYVYKINADDTATLELPTIEVQDGGTGGELSYQWYKNTIDSNESGTAISDETEPLFVLPTATLGKVYYYAEVTYTNNNIVTEDNVNEVTITSDVAEVIVYEVPVFTEDFEEDELSCGDNENIVLSVKAEQLEAKELDCGETIMYQWYVNHTMSNEGGIPIDGATSASYSPPVKKNTTRYYYAEAFDANYGDEVAVSNVIKVYVWDHERRYGIDYDSVIDVIVTGEINNTKNDEYQINLTEETLTVPESFKVKAYSIDGGDKWKTVSKPFNDATLKKLITKDITLILTNSYDKKEKKPKDDAMVVKFPEIKKRPASVKYVINYLIGSDSTGETTGSWLLTEKNGTTAVKEGIEIAVAKGKVPDEKGFGKFYPGENNGVQVEELTGSKPAKIVYFIRVEAKNNGDGTYTAAGKPKKISAAGEQKAPKYKLDTKNKVIKYKPNTNIFKGDILAEDADLTKTSLQGAKGELNVSDYSGAVYIWIAATAKKPVSAKLKFTVNYGNGQ